MFTDQGFTLNSAEFKAHLSFLEIGVTIELEAGFICLSCRAVSFIAHAFWKLNIEILVLSLILNRYVQFRKHFKKQQTH